MKLTTLVLGTVGVVSGIWFASEWWETGLAQPRGKPTISPSGCYRIETFKPFWLMPNMFHRRLHPDDTVAPEWFPWWGTPGFYRLYDERNGKLLGQSNIHDLEHGSGPLWWGDNSYPEVSIGMTTIGPNTPDCIGDKPASSEKNQ